MNEECYMEQSYRCGFVALVGRPNVGKSTLMNHLIGQKVSITSKKAQTTRHKVNGVYTSEIAQIIFVDTPGFQMKHLNPMNERLNQNVLDTMPSVDVVVLVIEAGKFTEEDLVIYERLPANVPIICVVNKFDKIKNKALLELFISHIEKKYQFKHIIPVSAKHGHHLNDLMDLIPTMLPESPALYPEDMLTDKSSRFLASEIIREKIFRYLGEELPYSVNVEIKHFTEEENLYRIYASILTERDGQKGILIGKKGEKLKKIGTDARKDMEHLFDKKVYLKLVVKVKTGWSSDIRFLNDLGM
ncbi:MAG: GTPase Era [Neisseriaceae bacterium]|nr:GTPase Era [Neisseriaceae bacterium]